VSASDAADATVLPMFPLGSVLFPSMPLVLHVFEPRYRTLTRHCLDGDRRLGVVLIERGSEVGGDDVRCSVGTLATIVDAVELADGRWALGLIGEHRIRVEEWLPDDPYPVARVESLPDRAPPGDREEQRAALLRRLRQVLALRTELGESAPPATVDVSSDPASAAWQVAVLAGLGPADGQKVLETVDLDARLARLGSLLDEQAEVLARRVAGG